MPVLFAPTGAQALLDHEARAVERDNESLCESPELCGEGIFVGPRVAIDIRLLARFLHQRLDGHARRPPEQRDDLVLSRLPLLDLSHQRVVKVGLVAAERA
jgi:hypothetical protein